MFEAFGVSTAVVAIAEIGDKTQLLAIVLAATFRRPVPILLGILCATLLNHALAAALGVWLGQWVQGPWMQTLLGLSFILMAGWALIPDKDEGAPKTKNAGAFVTTLIAFFLVEIGDKTQIATTLLAARFADIAVVTAGTTLGMMLANAPAVFFGEAITRLAPLKVIRLIAAALFAIIGATVLVAAWWS